MSVDRGEAVERLEVIAGPTGRRSWSEAAKARIVVESFAPGARVVDVARRHRVQPQQVTTWRREARQGKLALPADDDLDFAALVVDEAPASAPPTVGAIEIEAGGVIVRMPAEAPAARIAEIVAALRAS